jgi:hypothetical protein
MAPKHMGREAGRNFNAIIDRITEVPVGAHNALQNYLFTGDANPDKTITDESVQYIMARAAGHPIDEYLFVDGRVNNN